LKAWVTATILMISGCKGGADRFEQRDSKETDQPQQESQGGEFHLQSLPVTTNYANKVALQGVNLAGLEFDSGSYVPTTKEVDYYAAKGMNVIRRP